VADLDDDLDALMESGPQPRHKQCLVAFVLANVNDEQRSKIEALVDGDAVPATRIATVLQGHGFHITHTSIARHRRRKGQAGCSCP